MIPVILVAHGSRDPRAARTTRALCRAAAGPGLEVRPAYLDHTVPSLHAALGAVSRDGFAAAVLVPLLLTEAYHGRVDIPAVLAEARAAGLPVAVHLAPVLGRAPAPPVPGRAVTEPDSPAGRARVEPELAAAVRRRLGELRTRYDGIVLAAAGTRDPAARSTVDDMAAVLGDSSRMPCVAGYASATGPPALTVGGAVAAVRARGATRVAVASYFLAPGFLHDRALSMAFSAGVVGASAPLGAAPELVRLVLARARQAVPVPVGPRPRPAARA